MVTLTEEEFERVKGRVSDLDLGSHTFGAIMKKPWLHTAFSISNFLSNSFRYSLKFISLLLFKYFLLILCLNNLVT